MEVSFNNHCIKLWVRVWLLLTLNKKSSLLSKVYLVMTWNLTIHIWKKIGRDFFQITNNKSWKQKVSEKMNSVNFDQRRLMKDWIIYILYKNITKLTFHEKVIERLQLKFFKKYGLGTWLIKKDILFFRILLFVVLVSS